MELHRILAQEIVNSRKAHRFDGKQEAKDFIEDIRNLKILCFDKRVPIFTNNQERYSAKDLYPPTEIQ